MKAEYQAGYIFITGKISEIKNIYKVAKELVKSHGFVDSDCVDIDDNFYTVSLKTFETISQAKESYKLAKQVIKNN